MKEIQSQNDILYVVQLEDKTSIKNLRVTRDGKIDVWEELIKNSE